jgi:hypothetical protein
LLLGDARPQSSASSPFPTRRATALFKTQKIEGRLQDDDPTAAKQRSHAVNASRQRRTRHERRARVWKKKKKKTSCSMFEKQAAQLMPAKRTANKCKERIEDMR